MARAGLTPRVRGVCNVGGPAAKAGLPDCRRGELAVFRMGGDALFDA